MPEALHILSRRKDTAATLLRDQKPGRVEYLHRTSPERLTSAPIELAPDRYFVKSAA